MLSLQHVVKVLEITAILASICLTKLVEMDLVEFGQVNGKWRVDYNDIRLAKAQMYAAASLDKSGQPVLYIRRDSQIKGLMYVVPHEAVHIMQLCKGDLIPGYDGQCNIWKGVPYPSLPADDPNYFIAQPWEAEAKELEQILREHVNQRCMSK